MTSSVDAKIAALAAHQAGNVRRSQLLMLGIGPDAIDYRLRTGKLFRVYPGVYSVGRPPVTLIERAYAAALACGDGSVVGMECALAHWGFAKHWPSRMEIVTSHNRRPKGIVVHRSSTLLRSERTRHLGLPVTSPARTVLDCAPHLTERRLRRTVDDALHGLYLKVGQLAEMCELHPHHPGTKLILPFVTRNDGPSRSDWEVPFPDECVAAGLPRPQMNTMVLGAERDAWFAQERLIVELDSRQFHDDEDPYENDRERDVDMLDHDVATVRITWKRYKRAPENELARLGRILAKRRANVQLMSQNRGVPARKP